MGKMLLQQGILPSDFYNMSFSDLMAVQKAKSRKDRVQDPLKLAMSAGGLSSL